MNNKDIIKNVIQLVPRRKRSMRVGRIRATFPGEKINLGSELLKRFIEAAKRKKGPLY